MKHSYFLFLLPLFYCLSACTNSAKNEENVPVQKVENSSILQFDHLNIWTKNPEIAQEKLRQIGFTPVPDSMCAIHHGQGTTGRYFNFLNGYLELIFIQDSVEFNQNNNINPDLDFAERNNFQSNGASPFSLALNLSEYAVEKIPFETICYHQDWMDENSSIYCAKNSKINLKEPSVFVVFPEIKAMTFESTEDLKNTPSDDDSWKELFQHSNGAEKITSIIVTSDDLNSDTETIKALNGISEITVKNGTEHLLELYFDNNRQNKTFDLRPELPLKIYL